MHSYSEARWVRVCVCVCVCVHRCARRITATANLYDIPLHYYHSRSPVQLIIAGDVWDVNLQCNVCTVCSALLGKKNNKKKISEHTVQNSRTEVWCCSDPSCCSNTSLWGFSVFSWCNLLGSWQSCRALSAPSKRHGLSPNVLWLEFWSFKIFLSHLFSPLSLTFLSLSFSLLLPGSLCFSLSVCVSRRITE